MGRNTDATSTDEPETLSCNREYFSSLRFL